MCGIAGAVNLSLSQIPNLDLHLKIMDHLEQHRGPDGHAIWCHPNRVVGFVHRRLSIIDLTTAGNQPMTDGMGNWVTFNGEIYNYIELRKELGLDRFTTDSDTEVILHAYRRWGADCVNHFRGMFAFALWDESTQTLFCARDRFGIKPLYYATVGNCVYFASEAKALLPFLPAIETDLEGLKDYLVFQFCLAGKTLFRGISELAAGHWMRVSHGTVNIRRYWEVYYNLDWDHTAKYFEERIAELLDEAVKLHLRADVPVGAYISGGLDSSIVASLASKQPNGPFKGFIGKFSYGPEYDESMYALALSEMYGFELEQIDITLHDFLDNIQKVIYHLDYPVAGPGSFPQYMVSQLAHQSRKVVLGGQGGDEIFGGYTRYLIAYFEQCIKGAIDGTMNNGNFIVTYESIIPNLTALKGYKPLLQEFWREGLFDDLDKRYFRLINRAPLLGDEINWQALESYSSFKTFQEIFNGDTSDPRYKKSYFDSMTHFDFKTLLPALLHVEDRVSMAHGLESRVPFLDHPLVELVATIPSNIKFKDGDLKHILKTTMRPVLPPAIADRTNKMGFPVPLNEWIKNEARDFIYDVFSSQKALNRDIINNRIVLNNIKRETKFGRTTWGLLSLELWQQQFHDRQAEFNRLFQEIETVPAVMVS